MYEVSPQFCTNPHTFLALASIRIHVRPTTEYHSSTTLPQPSAPQKRFLSQALDTVSVPYPRKSDGTYVKYHFYLKSSAPMLQILTNQNPSLPSPDVVLAVTLYPLHPHRPKHPNHTITSKAPWINIPQVRENTPPSLPLYIHH